VSFGPERSGILVEDLSLSYGSTQALRSVSFQAQAGEIVAILGPNGAGKTSTLRCVEGYQEPDEGRVLIDGLSPIEDQSKVMDSLGIMLQEGGIYPALSPLKATKLFASYYPSPLEVPDLLERLGLSAVARTPLKRLSGGERQRLSLALCLIGQPSTLVLDEPTAGVDPEGRQVIREVIAELRSKGATILLTTHELDEVERLADRVIIMDRGQIVANETLGAMRAQGSSLSLRSVSNIDLSSLKDLGYQLEEFEAGHYRLETEASPEAISAVTAWMARHGHPLESLSTGSSLEDRYHAVLAAARESGSAT